MQSNSETSRPCHVDTHHAHQHPEHPEQLLGRLRTALDSLDGLTDALSAMVPPCCDGRGEAHRTAAAGGDDVFAALRAAARFELLEARPALPAGRVSGTDAHHRLIVGLPAGDSPGAAARLAAVTGRGALVRTVALLPLHIAVADRERVAVALELGGGPMVVHTTRATGTARDVARRFLEDWWPRARPCAPGFPASRGALTGTEAAVIDGLAQGLTDESVARRVGVTPRTVRRHVAAVSERFGAASRLQLGLILGRATAPATPAPAAGGPSPARAAAPPPGSPVPVQG
ncbi:response regulator transcription factor [Streptomyces peucetius]|uniref:Helix-turn-helix transcriptional regulator n=1 Tax=Streptomyces peucetius TaxID=1950 RepID=A0ABY6I0Z7_STRPE|nr:helix-turn-helix transcriptional regulator [Streptomyces peucetius]UYQ60643.1 helix-turn-helix transcriptional regulator [Streptomyces peucetius]